METLVLVGVAVLLLVGAVLLQRQRQRTSPGHQQTSAGGGLAQELSPSPEQAAARGAARPLGPQQRRQMLRYLKSAYDRGSGDRLAAMEDMVAWGHPACLPLLRRGLRDADLRVVGLAARGLERFRGPRQRLRHSPRRPVRPRGSHPSPPA